MSKPVQPGQPIQGFAIPWYREADYPAFRAAQFDADKLPLTFAGWQQQAQKLEQHLTASGAYVVRITIDPAEYRAWLRGRQSDVHTRDEFAAFRASEQHRKG